METSQQQRRPTVGQLAKTLAHTKLPFDTLDLADMLWLAQFIELEESALPEDKVNQTETKVKPTSNVGDDKDDTPTLNLYANRSSESKTKQSKSVDKQLTEKPKAMPFSVPAATALRTRLDLARALRPLMRKLPSQTRFDLDEDATVNQIAETEVWMPVVRARPERWLELDLVVEVSNTTVIWERTIADLNHLVEYQGAFRTVRTWRLDESAGEVRLFPRWSQGFSNSAEETVPVSNQRPRTPRELIDPVGRRLIWLVTDCTSTLWRQGKIYNTLLEWGKNQPTAIVQMFPERLWSRTALRDGHIVRLSSLAPGLPNIQLEVEGLPRRLERRNSSDLVTMPIVTLDATAMGHWARMVSGAGDTRASGRTFDLTFIQKQAEKVKASQTASSDTELTAQDRVAIFRSTASKTARQLANLMAAAPVTPPVIDLLRDAFRSDFSEEVQQSNVAEVLLSGLLYRCKGKECRYEFWGDGAQNPDERVRDILLGDASVSKTVEVLDTLTVWVCQKLGSPTKSFQAMLTRFESLDNTKRETILPFARIGANVLLRLGGEYTETAQMFNSEPKQITVHKQAETPRKTSRRKSKRRKASRREPKPQKASRREPKRLDIRELNLGSDSAERDINVGLTEYFYPTTTYQRFLSNRKTILVGGRGTGKTAIFKYIAAIESRKDHLVLELSMEEYSYELLSEYFGNEGNALWRQQSAYSVAWQYLLYTLIFKKIAQKKRGLLLGATKNIYNYVSSQNLFQQKSSIIMLVDYLRRIENVKLSSGDFRRQELQALYDLDEIKILLPSLKAVLKNTEVKILIDELDRGWDNSEDAKSFIAGLLQATQKLNLISPNLRVHVSIRETLFENIPQIYEDAQKIREDVEVIRWGRNELVEMIGRRIVHSFPQANMLDAYMLWQSVFVGQMQSSGTETLDYVIDRTQLRPRELLQFCKLCAERIVYSPAGRRIDEIEIANAEDLYSEQKTRDLASEYRFQYPYLLDIFEVFRRKRSHYDKEELDYLLLAIVSGEYDVKRASSWVIDIDYLELKGILWKIGFFKGWLPKASGGNSKAKLSGRYVGHYEVPTINLENISRFQIHPACNSFLNLQHQE